MHYLIGVDVGTGSARAGVFDTAGRLLASASCSIALFRDGSDFVEQSSDNIWEAVCTAVREALARSAIAPSDVVGLGFDATCSLVVLGAQGKPLTVSLSGSHERNIIVWMDHRATEQADVINATAHPILKYTGGRISPEMQLPKLLWLKQNLKETWRDATAFFDLPDWLVHRATETMTRSLCSAVCKWTYQGHLGLNGEGWDTEFLAAIGLDDLTPADARAIGARFAAPGEQIGGLSSAAAEELGLPVGIAVAASLIDAYAGALGTIGVGRNNSDSRGRLALIAGTSSCHIVATPEPAFVPGVWGPYFSVLLPGLWANEAGQSAAGALIDRVLSHHPAQVEARHRAKAQGVSEYAILDETLASMAGEGLVTTLTHHRHVQPDFHGNRSPLADPTRTGAMAGLTLDSSLDDLALDYLATLQALGYGTRQIVETLRQQGLAIDTLVVSGGLAQNALFVRQHAEITGCTVLVPDQTEPVLLGSAMLAAVAAGRSPSLADAARHMSGVAVTVSPGDETSAMFHDKKYRVFVAMQNDGAAYDAIMAGKDVA